MSFVMIATGGADRARVRTVSSRRLAAAAAGCAVVLLASGAGLGWWLARANDVPVTASAAPAHRAPLVPFAIEQLGALSARLFRLESEAAQLRRRIAPAGSAEAAASAPVQPGSGGPMLPPRPDPQDVSGWEDRLEEIETQLAQVADWSAERAIARLRLPTRVPVASAAIVSAFGNRSDPFTSRRAFHAGLDFAAPTGEPIQAAGGGVVRYAGHRPDYGWTVEIDHGNGLATRYAHASRLLVKAGALVAPGDRVALVGSTGRSTGPHLHFEVLQRGETVDPRRYLALH